MDSTYSKICSDTLRGWCPEIKASHARELVAAFFGYKSHAALLADSRNSIEFLSIAAIIIPDEYAIDERRASLNGLPDSVLDSYSLIEGLIQDLQDCEFFTGEIWERDDLDEFIIEKYLPEHLDAFALEDELKDLIAETNADFYDVEYEYAHVKQTDKGFVITVNGKFYGEHDKDSGKPFCGDTINLEVVIELNRVAGHVFFEEPEITVTGTIDMEGVEDDEDDEEEEEEEEEEDAEEPATV